MAGYTATCWQLSPARTLASILWQLINRMLRMLTEHGCSVNAAWRWHSMTLTRIFYAIVLGAMASDIAWIIFN